MKAKAAVRHYDVKNDLCVLMVITILFYNHMEFKLTILHIKSNVCGSIMLYKLEQEVFFFFFFEFCIRALSSLYLFQINKYKLDDVN